MPTPMFSLASLLPTSGPVPKDSVFVILKSYFDGGNQADSTRYDVVTLASISGTNDEWGPCESEWKSVLKKHGVPFLHTTDAVSLQNYPFRTVEDGWTKEKTRLLISDCVAVIDNHMARQNVGRKLGRLGIYPYIVTVALKDFVKARDSNPEVPKTATEVLATQCLAGCFEWGRDVIGGAIWYHLFFDKGEPFRGHIQDRWNNKKSKKRVQMMDRITQIAESDMRQTPALQIADLFAWCVNHRNKQDHPWQRRLLSFKFPSHHLGFDRLVNPIPNVHKLVESWKLPKRKAHR